MSYLNFRAQDYLFTQKIFEMVISDFSLTAKIQTKNFPIFVPELCLKIAVLIFVAKIQVSLALLESYFKVP